MGRRNFRKKISIAVSAFTAVFISLMILASSSELSGDSDNSDSQDIYEEELPTPINKLLSNQISNLEETEKLDRQIEKFLKRWEIKGASFAVMKDEKLIYAKGYGWADEEKGERMEVSHILRIASVSKLITAAGIMKLCEDSKLSLDDKVFGPSGILNDSCFQNIRDKRMLKITVEQLLRHKAGFTLHRGDPLFSVATLMKWEKWDVPPDTDRMIEYVLSERLGYNPGSGTRYSNVGYLILSKIIEKTSGMGYEEYIQKNILHPAGCYDFHIAKNYYQEKYGNEVRYYEPSNEPLVEHFDGSGRMVRRCYGGNNIEALLGAGAWVASPTELLKFVAAIDGRPGVQDILSAESISIMTKSGASMLPIGWSKTNRSYWSRTGSLSGSSAIIKYQEDGLAWVFITNTSSWKGSKFPNYIDYMVRNASSKIKEWPDKDLFNVG